MADNEGAGNQAGEVQENPNVLQLPELFFHLHRNDEFMMKEYRGVICPEEVEDMPYHHDKYCPFFHPGHTYRRRPQTFKYVPKLCPRLGNCALGDSCLFCHNIFEYCLHPKVYRKSNRCFDGNNCVRFPCMFPHNPERLRAGLKPPLHAPPRPKTPPLAPLPPLGIPLPREEGGGERSKSI